MADIFDIALGKALDSVGTAGSPPAAPNQDRVFDALIGQESGGKQFDKNGAPLASKAGAIGIAQVMPATAPEAAKLAGLDYDEMRYRTDPEYNKSLGRAYYNKQLQDFDGDTSRALAAYNAGPGRVRTALATAEKNGSPEAWMQFLPRETQQYVPSILRKVGLGMPVAPSKDFVTPTGSEYVDAAKAREQATIADFGKELVASAIEGVGSMAQFAGEGAAAIANKVTGSTNYESFNPLKPVSEGIRDAMTEGGKQARAGAKVEGSVTDLLAGDAELPSNVDSWLMMAAQGFGSLLTTLVPMAGPAARVASLTKAARAAEAAGDAAKAGELFQAAQAASRTSRAIGVGTGGAMTGGAAADDVRQSAARTVAQMSHEQLLAEVPAYGDAFSASGDEQSARQAVVNNAAQYAALGAAAFGAAGGYLNARVLEDFVSKKGMAAVLGDSVASRSGRAAIGGGVTSVAEGGQEVTEKVGQNVGENLGLGRAADANALRNTAGDFIGGAIVGGGVGTVGGAMTGPSAQPVVPPALQPVAAKAAEPNSPLSRAAMAGNAGALSGAAVAPGGIVSPANGATGAPSGDTLIPPADPRGPAADELVQRVRNLEEGMRNEGWLDNLRADRVNSRDVMLDMALARDTNELREDREAALERVESAVYFANRDAVPTAPMDSIQNNPDFDFTPPEPVSRGVPSVDAVAQALQDPALSNKISDQDRDQLQYLYDVTVGDEYDDTARGTAARMALEIVGRYQAPTGTPSRQTTPALEQAAPAPAGLAAPVAQQNVGESPQELDFLTTAQAPQQPRGPLGGDETTPAFLRKRANVVRQLVGNGFETVARDGSAFFLTNTKTGQKFELEGPADAQLARKAIKDRVDQLANTAAASPQNDRTAPTEAQIAAGNYKKSDVIDLNGMRIKIENPQGSTRRGTAPDGKAWETKMAHHYGEFQGTVGADGDKLDVFVGPRPDSSKVFVIDQRNADGSFDEHKVMLGFTSPDAAQQGYLANYEPGWTGLGAISEMSVDQFKTWSKSRAAKQPAATAMPAGAPTAATGTATPAVPAVPAAPAPDLSRLTSEWDQRNRRSRSEAWFEGAKVESAAVAGFSAALQNGGAQLPAHGMSKEPTLSGAVQNLLGLLQNGLDSSRRGGRLDYAPLVTARGSAQSAVSTTPGGSAYSDGPFMLVARPGQEFTGKLEGVGAVLVNESHPEIVPALRAAVQAIRPDIVVDTYGNAGEVAKQLTLPSAPQATAPGPAPAQPAPAPAAQAVSRIDVADIVARNTNAGGITAADKVAEEIHGAAEQALAEGKSVTYFAEGKPHKIVTVERGMMKDDKGQRWGTLLLMQSPRGERGTYVEITEASSAQPGAAVEAAITTPNANFTAAELAESAAPLVNQPQFFNVNDGGKQRKLRVIKSAELPETAGFVQQGARRYRALSQDEANLMQQVAAMLNKQVVFYKADDGGRVSDGFVIPGLNNTIFVASETTINPLAILGHEFFHTLRATNPKAWDAIAAVVAKNVRGARGYRDDRSGSFPVVDAKGELVQSFRREEDAKKFIADSKRDDLKIGKHKSDKLGGEVGGELEELVSDLGGNLIMDPKFWGEVFSKIKADNGAEAKGIIANLSAALKRFIKRFLKSVDVSGYKADKFVKDLDQVRAAFRDALAQYLQESGINQRAMAAETLKAEQQIKKSEDRVKRAHTQLKKNGLNDWSATTDLRDEGIPVLLQTRTSGGALITSATEFVDGRETTKNITGTPKMKVDQMSIGNHHKLVVQRFREMAKIAGIRKSEDRVDDKPEGLTVTGYHFSPQARPTLSTAFFGTGLKGSAREEILSSADGRIRQRLSFYYDKGTGVRPEAGVGGIAHKATLTNIYDADRDPLKLKGGNARAFESKVVDAGYNGYLARLEGTQPGQVILLGNQTVTPEVLGPRSRIGGDETGVAAAPAPAPAPVKKGLMSRELNELNVDAIPGATLRAGMLTVPPDAVFQANAELERIGSPVRFSPDRDDPELAQSEYAAVESQYKGTEQWLKAPNGNASNLAERQWVQVRTPAFKAWFGDWEAFAGREGGVWNDDQGDVSKVVDANGEPLVVYHGASQGGFMEFNETGGERRGDLGIFATANEGMAASYVRRNRPRRVEEPKPTDEQTGWRYIDKTSGRTVFTMRMGDDPETIALREQTNDATAVPLYGAGPEAGSQPGIYALFVNLRQPEESDFEGANWDGERYGQYQVVDADGDQIYAEDGRGYLSEDEAQDLAADNSGASVEPAGPHYETTDSVVRAARRSQQDGAIIRQVMDDGGGPGYDGEPSDIFVAFDPNQVKSADFNGGAFSRSENDIRKSADRDAQKAAKKAASEAKKASKKMDAAAAKEGAMDPAMVVSTKPGRAFEIDGKNYRVVTYPRTRDVESATARLHTRIRDVLRGSEATRFLEAIGELAGKSLKLGQIRGLWAGEREDTFTIWARNTAGNPLPFEASRKLANLLGFAFVQEGAVTSAPAYNEDVPGIPAVLIGNGKDLDRAQVDAALDAAHKAGFFGASESATGKGVKFLFFPDAESEKSVEQQFREFLGQVEQVQKATGLNARTGYNTKSALDSAKEYWKNATGKELGAEDLRGARNPDSGAGSPDLFRGLVDNLLAPYIAGIRIEGFDFSYANWQRVFGATPEQTRYLRSKVAELEAVNKHGVVKKLRQTTSIVDQKDVGTAAELMLKTTEGNADEQLDVLDRVLAASPDAVESTDKWLLMQARAYGTNDVPMAPNRFIQMYNGDGIYDQLKVLSPGQVADADHGFAAGREFRRLYESGKVKPETTAKLMLWSFLSRGVSPYVQESAFIDLVGKVDPFIAKVLAGTFSDADVAQWEAVVAEAIRKGTGQPGAGTTHNANAFASSFMVGMSRRMPDGRTKMQFMHDLFSDPRRTGREIRREFVKISEGVGIDNKVISFTMLVIGHDDVAVLDRVQIANTYNDGRLGDYNLYDGVSRYGYEGADKKTVWVGVGEQAKLEAEAASANGEVLSALLPGSGMANLTTGVRGLMLYESIENALDRKLPQIFARLRAEGLRSDELRPTVGRWHWESWVAYSGQEASHKTLEALLNEVKGVPNPFADVAAKEGEYGAFSYGTEYAIGQDGERYKLYPDSAGVMRRMSLDDYKALMGQIKKPANRVIPSRFKVSENADGSQRTQPWFMDPRVNRQALDTLIDRIAGPKPVGKIVASADREVVDAPPAATLREEVPAAEAKGRQVTYEVEVEDTGETARLTVDAADALTDYDERIATAKKLLECLNK